MATDSSDDELLSQEIIEIEDDITVGFYSMTHNRIKNHHSFVLECPKRDTIDDFTEDLVNSSDYNWYTAN